MREKPAKDLILEAKRTIKWLGDDEPIKPFNPYIRRQKPRANDLDSPPPFDHVLTYIDDEFSTSK